MQTLSVSDRGTKVDCTSDLVLASMMLLQSPWPWGLLLDLRINILSSSDAVSDGSHLKLVSGKLACSGVQYVSRFMSS